MFENAAVMVLLQDRSELEICKLETDRKTQKVICQSFADAYDRMMAEREQILFDGNYKPEEDEIFYIPDYRLDEWIEDAVKRPAGSLSFIPDDSNKDRIKAIFVGEVSKGKVTIAFQKFKKEQYINVKGINLFFDRETFVQEKRFGMSISEEVDCIFESGNLLFRSFFMARQIFDLSDYYREATEKEVLQFARLKKVELEEEGAFMGQADSRVRRKIASILDSGVLENYSAQTIQRIGRNTGIAVKVKNKRIVIPADKKEMKIILGFLDEEVYKGVFSSAVYIANSKRFVN